MSEGKRFLTFSGRCFMAKGYQQLPAIHSRPQAAEQCCLVLSSRQALCAVLEKCFFCVGSTLESGRQRGDSGPSVGLTGGISHGGPMEQICPDNGNEELMEMPI